MAVRTAAAERSATDAAQEQADRTVAAHGGDKLKNLGSILLKGSADLNAFGQSIPGSFTTAISGQKYFFEVDSSIQRLKQVFDGKNTYSSIQGFSLPPITSLGFPLLAKVGTRDHVVGPLPAESKKKKGFRITTPEGFYTDFIINEKTDQIKGYESSYEVRGRLVTTAVEIDAFQTVDGIVVPQKYSQRFDLGQMTAYANFKAKVILVNSKIEDDVFAIPTRN